MTRRIALAILATTWISLIVTGVGIYLATRYALLTDLDETIVARAMALPEAAGTSGGSASAHEDDRYVVRNAIGQTLGRPSTTSGPTTPVILNRVFVTLADDRRLRTITLSVDAPAAAGRPVGVTTITYSSSAEHFDRLLNQLIIWLIVIALLAGVCAAAAAVYVSRYALRPLLKTAELIGEIDESKLDRRIDLTTLPPELGPMAQRLNEMLARMESAFDQRTRFLADASHELRTPIASLMTTIEVALRRPRDASALTEILDSCLSDTRAMRSLVERLMQQVRSELPSPIEATQSFDAVAFFNDCVGTVRRTHLDKEIELQCHLPAELHLHTEQDRLRGVVINLLSNAIEYTPAGGSVELSCEVNHELVIAVSDTGPGMAPELLEHLFEPFVRGDQPRGSACGHLGLGLSIVRGHVRALGGRCEVNSVLGAGTTFRISLPSLLIVPILEGAGIQ